MRGRILSFILAVYSATPLAADECEPHLKTSIAVVTERALAQGRLTQEQVQEMSESETPLNPLRFATPSTATMALKRFFDNALPSADWARARRELRAVLERRMGSVRVQREARIATARAFLPRLEIQHDTTGLKDLKIMPDGQLYMLLATGAEESVVKHFLKAEPIATMSGPDSRLEAAEDGSPQAVVYREKQVSRWTRGFHWNLVERSAKNLATGVVTNSELSALPTNTRSFSFPPDVNKEPIQTSAYSAIRGSFITPKVVAIRAQSGGYAVAAFADADNGMGRGFFLYYPPSMAPHESPNEIVPESKVSDLKILETADRRILLFVKAGLEILAYEPAVSLQPFFKVKHTCEFRVWEDKGRVFLAVAQENAFVRFFEPLLTHAAIAEAPAPHLMLSFVILPLPEQTYLVEQYVPFSAQFDRTNRVERRPSLTVYSLYNTTRP